MNGNMTTGIAVYKQDQYQDILKVSADAHKMDATWEEWLDSYQTFKLRMLKQGIELIDVEVDLFELMEYCQQIEKPITGATRAQFVKDKVRYGKY